MDRDPSQLEKRDKSIFEYDNYREYLRDYYERAKKEKRHFTYRNFSRLAGFKSPSVLKQVMDGKINIDPTSIEGYVKALRLNKEEAFFFEHLVLMNQAKTPSEKEFHAEQMTRSRSFRKIQPLKTPQFNFYRHWYYSTIRELVGLPDFREDYEWIAQHVKPSILVSEARNAVEELLMLGLLTRDEKGRLHQASANITTGDEVVSAGLTRFHKEMLNFAGESISTVPRDKRDISGLTLGISAEGMKIIKEMIQKFRKDVLEVAGKSGHPNSVYQLNFQFFPVSEDLKKDD